MSASAEPEDVKPKMNLTVAFNDLSIKIMVKANTPFKKVFEAASAKFKQNPGAIRFIYEGKRIKEHDTPLDFEMEDGDQIDAQVEQIGGACCWRACTL